MYAIISAGNKQYKVSQGETIYIDKVNQADGSAISFDAIMVVNEGDVKVGTPTVAGVTVEGKIVGQVKGEKIKIYKYKSKKNYRPSSALHEGGNHRHQRLMTRAVLFEDAAGRITGVSVKGHSGYAEEGSDIVCAGISTLLVTIDQALCSLVGLSPIEHGGEDGFAEVLLPPGITDKQMEQAQLLFGALRIGFSDIAEQYPAYFRLTIRKVH